MAKKTFKKGTAPEHWTKLNRSTMETPAWRALSPTAQALYPWLKLEWKGADYNNNGNIQLSVRQAAERLGVSNNTAAKAFKELQAKGFLIVRIPASLGLGGNAKGHSYILTELGYTKYTGKTEDRGKQLFRDWRAGNDFEVVHVAANNPTGRNGRKKQNPVSETKTERHKNEDGFENCVSTAKTGCLRNEDGLSQNRAEGVSKA